MPKKTIKNIDEVLKKLSKFGDDVAEEVRLTTLENAQKIVIDARNNAPIDLGKLRQGINTEESNDNKDSFNQTIFAREKYSAYMEFGTGGKVKVPNELKDIAIQFKGAGIKEINLQPQPFLYPAFVKGRKNYLKDLQTILEQESKKI